MTIDQAGILTADCGGRTITLRLNNITDALIGIFCYNNPASATQVFRNTITLSPSNPNFNARGIWIMDITPVSGGSLGITQNIITNMRFGILVQNKSAPFIIGNTVFVKNISNSNIFASGIFTSNCTGGNFVGVNTAESNIPNSDQNYWESGIRTDMSDYSDVQCNITRNIGDGLFSSGQMPNTQYKNNEMQQDHLRGFVQNFGFIGPQGANGSPNDNQWTGTFTFHTYTYFSNGSTFPFFVRNVIGPYQPSLYLPGSNQGPSFIVSLNPTTSTSGILCNVFKISDNIAFSRAVVANTTFSPEILLGRFAIFKTMPVDTGMNNDGVLVQFRDSMRNTEWGELDSVSRGLVVPLDINTAPGLTALNNSVVTTDTITLLHKQVNQAALLYSTFGSSTYTPAQVNRLRQIARLCPYTYGASVYMSRAILAGIELLITEYWSDCEMPHDPEDDDNDGRISGSAVKNAFVSKLYPNPNEGQMTLEYELPKGQSGELILFDYMGKQVGKYFLSDKQNILKVNETNLSPGIYLCKIYVNNQEAASEKIIINK